MEKQPQFPFAPKDFARCLNATCPRSQNCLRRTAALQDTMNIYFSSGKPAPLSQGG